MATPTLQLLARTVYATDGSTTVWNFAFSGGYLDKAHVKAFTETPSGARTELVITESMLIGEYQLEIVPALASGSTLTIYRDTPKNLPLVNFADASNLSEIALDTNAKQAVFIAAEAEDSSNSAVLGGYVEACANSVNTVESKTAEAVSAAQTAVAAQQDIQTNWGDKLAQADQAAQTATAGANTATTKADVATTQAGLSQTARVGAEAARDAAEETIGALAAPTGSVLVGFQQAGIGAVARTAQDKFREVVSAADFGVVGDDETDTWASLQAAVTYASTNSKRLFIPAGNYRISQPITFGPSSFHIFGESCIDTAIKEMTGAGQIELFKLNGVNSDTCVIENMAFIGPGGATLGGTGVSISASAGIDVRHCWFLGLTVGIRKTIDTADIEILNCTLEESFSGLELHGSAETVVDGCIFYLNDFDTVLLGEHIASNISNSNHLSTKQACYRFIDAKYANITNVSCAQEFHEHTPAIILLEGESAYNSITNVKTKNFGAALIRMETGANCHDNTFTAISATKVAPGADPIVPPPVGTLEAALEIGSGNSNNLFSNFNFGGCGYGIVNAGDNNNFIAGRVHGSTTKGVLIAGADNSSFTAVDFENGAVDDWQCTGTVPTVWVNSCTTTMIGLTPTRVGSKGAGVFGRIFYMSTDPATAVVALPFNAGDRVLNVNPSPGNPTGWVCVSSGTPGTWAAEANL